MTARDILEQEKRCLRSKQRMIVNDVEGKDMFWYSFLTDIILKIDSAILEINVGNAK